jgi:ABC-type Mn2+/Zn2+ transport system permease subunit
MIGEFLSSWPLFHNAYLAGWLAGVMLAVVGVIVVARNQIFIGAAIAQASTLGIALSMFAGALLGIETPSDEHVHVSLSFIGVAFAVGAALLTARDGGGGGTREAVTGWVFLASASGAILILAHSPHGLEEINHLVSSSIIGATRNDVWLFAGLALATLAAAALLRDRLLLFAIDPAMAAAVGMPAGIWSAALAAWLGLVVGLSMRVTGLLYTFASLVLPALIAAGICRESRRLFAVAPAVSLATGVAGFVLANHFDDPPAQTTVALQAVVLGAVWLLRRRRPAA